MKRVSTVLTIVALAASACAEPAPDADGSAAASDDAGPSWDVLQTEADRVVSIDGFAGPEAVRYDPDQDVWFVSNFGEDADDQRDGNGFISRVDAATDEIASLRFAVGTDQHPLHMPRGMYLAGDTLWVADVDGIHGFDRRTGEALAFVDFTSFEPGFLNDITAGPDGTLYVTDTGRSAVYSVRGGEVAEELAADPAIGNPNGITWDAEREVLVLVPWEPGHPIHAWAPGSTDVMSVGAGTPGRLDGVEVVDGRLLVASQTDSTLQLADGAGTRAVIRVPGSPADIAVDTSRRRVAVPYIALDRVDVWRLPGA